MGKRGGETGDGSHEQAFCCVRAVLFQGSDDVRTGGLEGDKQNGQDADADPHYMVHPDEVPEEESSCGNPDYCPGQEKLDASPMEAHPVTVHGYDVADDEQREQQSRRVGHRDRQGHERGGDHTHAGAKARFRDADHGHGTDSGNPEQQETY